MESSHISHVEKGHRLLLLPENLPSPSRRFPQPSNWESTRVQGRTGAIGNTSYAPRNEGISFQYAYLCLLIYVLYPRHPFFVGFELNFRNIVNVDVCFSFETYGCRNALFLILLSKILDRNKPTLISKDLADQILRPLIRT
jgi:hypothetical protein